MAATTGATTPTMPATTVTPLPPVYGGYQGSAAGAGAGAGAGVATAPAGHSSSGSIGAFFAVLAAVLVLTLLSCVFGRVCARQAEGPDERYHCGGLASRWCGWRPAPRRTVAKREAKPPVGEVPAALPPPEEP